MGAALFGFSLLGPQVGAAAADSTGDSSVSSGSTDSGAAGPARSTPAASDAPADAPADDAAEGDDDDEAEDEAEDEATEAEDEATDSVGTGDADGGSEDTPDDPAPEEAADPGTPPSADTPAASTTDSGDVDRSATADTSDSSVPQQVSTTVQQTAQVASAVPEAPQNSWDQFVATAIANWTAATEARIASLDVSDERKAALEASFLAMRRTFFNQAPTVAPIQISGRLTGPITGTVGATDADGDRLIYRLRRAPREGTVQLNADGTYTYTPDADFDGVDTFRVVAIDAGLHVNLLDPFRGLGTRANSLINQGAIKFAFNYTDGGTGWTAERRQALADAANDLVLYFMVTSPVTLAYNVNSEVDDSLASAGSDLVSDRAGFWRAVVQNKLLTCIDSNGAAADGEITWNWSYAWALGDTVGATEYDLLSTALHELLHSFGFSSHLGAPGDNKETTWTEFARYVRTADGVKPIDRRHVWNTEYDPNLTGGNGGLFFGGANAVAAYGGLVPLYTPNVWESGSSMGHLDDFTFTGANEMMMNAKTGTGLGVRVLSAVEIGIMRDLGYQVSLPQSPPVAMAFFGIVLLGRKRRSQPAPR